MQDLALISDSDLIARMPELVLKERGAVVEVIIHLIEIDRRKLYLEEACSSLYSYCKERLGYSEDEALRRVRVARLAARIPRCLDELGSGAIHLTGLFVLSQHLSDENCEAILTQARGKSRREIEKLLARWFPRPDVPDVIEPEPGRLPLGETTCASAGAKPRSEPRASPGTQTTHSAEPARPARVEPLSETRYRIEFTASTELADKIERARELLGHAIPGGDLAAIFERSLDALIERETKKRLGAGNAPKPHPFTPSGVTKRIGCDEQRRKLSPDSRHVPRDVARVVWERDGNQCTFVDTHGRRCSERRFVSIEHDQPFARGGLAIVENLRLLCTAHNARSARRAFGEAHIEKKKLEGKVLAALVRFWISKARGEASARGNPSGRVHGRRDTAPRCARSTGATCPQGGSEERAGSNGCDCHRRRMTSGSGTADELTARSPTPPRTNYLLQPR